SFLSAFRSQIFTRPSEQAAARHLASGLNARLKTMFSVLPGISAEAVRTGTWPSGEAIEVTRVAPNAGRGIFSPAGKVRSSWPVWTSHTLMTPSRPAEARHWPLGLKA